MKKVGTFYVDCEVVNIWKPAKSVIQRVLVDTGAESSWLPEEVLESIGISREKRGLIFQTADGREISRDMGYVILRASGMETVDEVVFGKPGDLKILGSRTLEGFHAVVDARRKRLIASGPSLAAALASSA